MTWLLSELLFDTQGGEAAIRDDPNLPRLAAALELGTEARRVALTLGIEGSLHAPGAVDRRAALDDPHLGPGRLREHPGAGNGDLLGAQMTSRMVREFTEALGEALIELALLPQAIEKFHQIQRRRRDFCRLGRAQIGRP